MNDAASSDGSGGGGGSSYDGFLADALAVVESIFEVVPGKIDEEEYWLAAESGTGGGVLNYITDTKHLGEDYYGESAPVIKRVKQFAKDHCFDYTNLEFAADEVATAEDLLDKRFGKARTKITRGLSTWDVEKNEAAKTFTENYVTSMDEFYKEQCKSLDHYYSVVLSSIGVAEANRKLLLDFLKDCKKLIDDYDPFWGVTNPWLSWTIDLGMLLVPEAIPAQEGVAFITRKGIELVASKLADGAKKSLESYESAALIVQGIMDGIDALAKGSNDTFDALAGFASQYVERDTAEKNVMLCPRY